MNANTATDLFVPQLLANMVDTCHRCHCCRYCVSLLHVWSQVLLSPPFHHVPSIWRPWNVEPKPPHTEHTAPCAACVSCAARAGGGDSLTECSWDAASGLGLHSIVCLHFYCLSLSLWLFSIMLNKGAELEPLPAVEPDTHTYVCHRSHTYWRYKAMNSKNKYLLLCQSVALKMIFYRESYS